MGDTLDELGIDEQISVVAHDFGGAFAAAWAAMGPQRARNLVFINHPFFVADYSWHFWARIWRTPLIGELSTLTMSLWPVFRMSLETGSRNLSLEKIKQAFKFMTPSTKKMILRLYRNAGREEFLRWEPRMLAATSVIPTLVLWGEHDPYIPSWVADRFGAKNVIRFDNSGHWVPAEVPDQVAEELLRFFADQRADEIRGNEGLSHVDRPPTSDRRSDGLPYVLEF